MLLVKALNRYNVPYIKKKILKNKIFLKGYI